MEKLTTSSEDYLEAIVNLGGTLTNSVRNIDISNELGVTKASVSKAIQVLREDGMVSQEPYGGVRLTPNGLARYGGAVPASVAVRVFDAGAWHRRADGGARGVRHRTRHQRCVVRALACVRFENRIAR